MVLVLAVHTVATVSATVPFAMIMLRYCALLAQLLWFALGARGLASMCSSHCRVPVQHFHVLPALDPASNRRDHVRKNDVSPGLHCRLVRAGRQFMIVCSVVSHPHMVLDYTHCTFRFCLAQAIALYHCGMYQTERLCRLGWTSFWMLIAPTRFSR